MNATIVRDRVALAYEECGPPASGAPPLVFVHGWSCDRSFFAPQAAFFSGTHRCVSIDLRGHGASDRPVGGPYTIEQFADDVAWMIGELAVVQPVVVGHSMGGAVALQLAASFPGVVRAVVLVDPAPLRPSGAAAQLSTGIASAAIRETQRSVITGSMFLARSDPSLIARIVDVMTSSPEHVVRGCWDSIISWDGVAAGRACPLPVLHIAAASPINAPHELAAIIPHVVTGWTVGGGHFNQLEVPDQVSSMIERFLHHHVT